MEQLIDKFNEKHAKDRALYLAWNDDYSLRKQIDFCENAVPLDLSITQHSIDGLFQGSDKNKRDVVLKPGIELRMNLRARQDFCQRTGVPMHLPRGTPAQIAQQVKENLLTKAKSLIFN